MHLVKLFYKQYQLKQVRTICIKYVGIVANEQHFDQTIKKSATFLLNRYKNYLASSASTAFVRRLLLSSVQNEQQLHHY